MKCGRICIRFMAIFFCLLFTTLTSFCFCDDVRAYFVVDGEERTVYKGAIDDFPVEYFQNNIHISPLEKYGWIDWYGLELNNVVLSNIRIENIHFYSLVMKNSDISDSYISASIYDSEISNCIIGKSIFSGSIDGSKIYNSEIVDCEVGLISLRNGSHVEANLLRNLRVYDFYSIDNVYLYGNAIDSLEIGSMEVSGTDISENNINNTVVRAMSLSNSAIVDNTIEYSLVEYLHSREGSVVQVQLESVNAKPESSGSAGVVRLLGLGILLLFILISPYLAVVKLGLSKKLLALFAFSTLIISLNYFAVVYMAAKFKGFESSTYYIAAYSDWWFYSVPISSIIVSISFVLGSVFLLKNKYKIWGAIFLFGIFCTHFISLVYFWLIMPRA